jgi:hypothetical protein
LSLYLQGITNPYELAQKTGYAIGSVSSVLYHLGIKRKRPKKNYKKKERNTMAKAILFELLNAEKSASQIAREYGVETIAENPLKTGEAGKTAGIKAAKGDFIALVDSDNILPDSGWLERIYSGSDGTCQHQYRQRIQRRSV